MTCRLGAFAAICRKTLMVRHVRSKLSHYNALIHCSVIRSDDPIEIKMPALSPTMTEGVIVKWLKKEGDSLSPGDVICEIQTDKTIVGFEVEEEGVLLKILMQDDSRSIKLGEVIALIGSEGSLEGKTIKPVTVSTPASEKVPRSTGPGDLPKLLGPAARKLLKEYDINFKAIAYSGPQGNIVKSDVVKYIFKNKLRPQEEAPKVTPVTEIVEPPLPKLYSHCIDIPMTSMRKTIARRLSESKRSVPHAYISIDCGVNQVTKLRKVFKDDGINVSVNDFVIKSVACALSKVPKVNIINANENPVHMKSIDISVAVATENGLITPIVKNADILSIQEISDTVKSLAMKAREGKLKLEEFLGGSFTISNLGMYGISEFSAVINPPQCAILAVGTVRLVAEENQPAQKMSVTLSYDYRLIDEISAGQFLQALKSYLENPSSILL